MDKNTMKSYIEIFSAEDMEKLLSSISGFHDSMTKEIHIMNRGYVNSDHSMDMGHKFDVQCLIQSQWEPYAMELIFCDVSELHLSDPGEYWEASGEIRKNVDLTEKTEIEMNFDASFKIKASRLFYRPQPNFLGKNSFLRHEVPSPDALPASKLEGNWRQCSNCKDAWEDASEEVFSFCPSCGILTEMN
jgi:hypothetical protein